MSSPAQAPYTLWLIGDVFDHDRALQKGATTRMMVRVAEELKQQYGVAVRYYGLDKDYETLLTQKPEGPTAALLVRVQDPRMATLLNILKEKDVQVFAHLADPHRKNGEIKNDIFQRAALHDYVYGKADGVIASSPANLSLLPEIGQHNGHYIPNPVDADYLAFIYGNWALPDRDEPIRFATSCYGLNLPGVFAFAEALEKANQNQTRYMLDVVTAGKKLTEGNTHAAASGTDFCAALQQMAQTAPWLDIDVSFLPKTLSRTFAAADIVVVPANPIAQMSKFQTDWQNFKDPTQIASGLAAGCLVAAQKKEGLLFGDPFPETWRPFIADGSVIPFRTPAELFSKLADLSRAEVIARIQIGQERLRRDHVVRAVAPQHDALYRRALHL